MRYRIVVRYLDERQRYHIEDIEAGSMADALRALIERVPTAVLADSDLVEVRPLVAGDEDRAYASG